MNIGGATKELAAEDAARAVDAGFPAVKDHFYHPVNENIQWLQAVREAVGPDVDAMHDPVAIYSFEQAVRIGRAWRSSTTGGWRSRCRSVSSRR